MRGDSGPGVGVAVVAEHRRLRLLSGSELVGDWDISQIGIVALQDGFSIKAEGEEFVLRTEDDVAFADEIGISAASPRLARRLAVRHNPEEPAPSPEPDIVSSSVASVGFAVAGALVAAGGAFLRSAYASVPGQPSLLGVDYWLLFVVGGGVMIFSAMVMSVGGRYGRISSAVVLALMIVVFGLAIAATESGAASRLAAYGLVAGGLVVGLAVLSSGAMSRP